MAHSYGERLSLPSPTPQQGCPSLPPPLEWHSGVSSAGRSPPLPGPARNFLGPPPRRALPIRRNCMTAWEASILGAEWAHEWSWWCTTTCLPGTSATQHTTGGSGTTHQAATHSNSWGGPWACVRRADHRMTPGTPTPPARATHRRHTPGHRRYVHGGATRPPSGGFPQRRGTSGSPRPVAKKGGLRTMTPCPRWVTFQDA